MKKNKIVKIGDRTFVAIKGKGGCYGCFFHENEEIINCIPNDDINACCVGDGEIHDIYIEKKRKKA